MIWETLKEQRRAIRRPVGYIATILADSGGVPRYCIVLDESKGGVRISIPHNCEVPENFTLRRYGGTETRYKVAWRKGRLIGAERIGIPKAH